jgi:chorismate synthase
MAGNSFGHIFRVTSFGESHGVAIGGVIDGCPSNLAIDLSKAQAELNRRRPGQSAITTDRKEEDHVEFLSGIFENKTLGSPIAFIIRNKDHQSSDYDQLKSVYRPSHADYTYGQKYGIRDHRGGGRSSARETAVRVVAGAIAKQVLEKAGVSIHAYVSQVGNIACEKKYAELDLTKIESNIMRCPEDESARKMIALVEQVKAEGDSIGGKITCIISGSPAGLGEPVYDRLSADLAKAMMSINAAKGFEIGSGFAGITMKGSEHNDAILPGGKTKTNFSGGIQGGISNGEEIYFNVAFKPVSTIKKQQDTIDSNDKRVKLQAAGRHDPCVVPRAVPVVEAMAAITILDHLLRNQATQIGK